MAKNIIINDATFLYCTPSGTVFISVKDHDKTALTNVASQFHEMGCNIMATRGTSIFLENHNIPNIIVNKVSLGRPHVIDAIKNYEINLGRRALKFKRPPPQVVDKLF